MLFWLVTAAMFIAINWYVYIYAIQTNQIFQGSLGYYINPLTFIAAGVIVLKEKLTRIQMIAVGLAYLLVQRGIQSRPAVPGPQIRSLAVLPFANLMNDPEQAYFVEGMHEALITNLSKIGALRVISRTSAMRYAASEKSLPEIARELDVDALIEGSVLRADGQVRVTAQLIDGESAEHLWAESYDRDLENVLSLLSEVAQAIAAEIEVTLTEQQQQRLAAAPTVDPAVQDLILRGQYHFNRGAMKGFREALDY
jgi:TolB-like protein